MPTRLPMAHALPTALGRATAPSPACRVRRASITNLGCKVNQAEMDAVVRRLRAAGVEIVPAGVSADLHVVNTCTVTAVADDKSRKAVRRARRASPGAAVVVTGCSVEIGRAAYAALDPAAHLVANVGKDELLGEIERLLGAPAGPTAGREASPPGLVAGALPTLAGVEIAGGTDGRTRIDRTRAFVKVQDGCSFHCTYCIIPRARGAERSIGPDDVLRDVRRAVGAGHREIVLTGINIGTYDGGWSEAGSRGAHARSALTLGGLVRRILAETEVERIRLSSIEPQHVDADLLDAWLSAGAGRCLPHFHLPLQSGDDGVLRRMGRRYDTAFYASVVARVRAAFPRAAVHADLIVGFPTEDQPAWERSISFVRSLDLAGIHVFRYSERPGTPATRMSGQVPEPARQARAAEALAIAAAARRRFAAGAVGHERQVLFEQPHPAGGWIGHAEDHLLVRSDPGAGNRTLAGQLARVAVVGLDPGDPERVVGRVLAVVPGPPAGHAPRMGERPVIPFAPGAGAPAPRPTPSGGPP